MSASRQLRKNLAVLAMLAVVASGCSRSDGAQRASTDKQVEVDDAALGPIEVDDTTSTSAEASTTTTAKATPTTGKPKPAGLARGSRGPEVHALEQALADQRYEVGRVDGVFDAMTGHGVMAFQKIHGLARTGRATPDVLAKLPTVGAPGAMMPGGGANRAEVDLKRQVLQIFKGGQLERVISVSTGNNKRYCVDGECDTAVTPGGSFRVTRKISGIRVSRLGELFDPVYFNGGIAIHGSPSVPAYPASHGCVRVPMGSSKYVHSTLAIGTPVYVLGGKRAPVPFNEKAPGEAPAPTTTTAKPTTTTAKPATTTTTARPTTTTQPPTTTTTTAPAE